MNNRKDATVDSNRARRKTKIIHVNKPGHDVISSKLRNGTTELQLLGPRRNMGGCNKGIWAGRGNRAMEKPKPKAQLGLTLNVPDGPEESAQEGEREGEREGDLGNKEDYEAKQSDVTTCIEVIRAVESGTTMVTKEENPVSGVMQEVPRKEYIPVVGCSYAYAMFFFILSCSWATTLGIFYWTQNNYWYDVSILTFPISCISLLASVFLQPRNNLASYKLFLCIQFFISVAFPEVIEHLNSTDTHPYKAIVSVSRFTITVIDFVFCICIRPR